MALPLLMCHCMTSRIFSLLILVVGCGGSVSPITGDSGTDGEGPDGSPGPGPNCPSGIPTVGAACSKEGIACEYGTDVRWTCNTVMECSGGVWGMVPQSDQGCPTHSAPECPASLGDLTQGAACTPSGISFNYSTPSVTEFCSCTFMGGPIMADAGSQTTWLCSNGMLGGCPTARPALGSACSQPNLDCDYSVCGAPSGLGVQCSGTTSTWVQGMASACAGAN
jgi:hypothetical protein